MHPQKQRLLPFHQSIEGCQSVHPQVVQAVPIHGHQDRVLLQTVAPYLLVELASELRQVLRYVRSTLPLQQVGMRHLMVPGTPNQILARSYPETKMVATCSLNLSRCLSLRLYFSAAISAISCAVFRNSRALPIASAFARSYIYHLIAFVNDGSPSVDLG